MSDYFSSPLYLFDSFLLLHVVVDSHHHCSIVPPLCEYTSIHPTIVNEDFSYHTLYAVNILLHVF